MSRRLEQRAAQLRADGADPLRLEVLEAAHRFKRSWIEMARALLQVRETRAFEGWGYADLHSYCAEELSIKPRTVDKLTGSYQTLERHAPDLLKGDVARPVPSVDAVDYFARLVGENDDDPPEAIEELRQAVFDEARPVGALRKQFNPILCPRSDAELARDAVRNATLATRRLASLLPAVSGLSRRRRAEVVSILQALEQELTALE
jgi:hypothetical protein